MEIIQNSLAMFTRPFLVILIFKLLASEGHLDLPVLFTVYLCPILINTPAILNSHAYIDIVQIAIKNIERFLK